MVKANGAWRVVGASVQGAGHRAEGLACQDAQFWRVMPSGELIVALADGAGSAPCAAQGAQAAVVAAAGVLGEHVASGRLAAGAGWPLVIAGAYRGARAVLEQLAGAAGRPLRDFATTLTCVVAWDDGVVTGQIGDGLVAAEGANGLFLAARPQRGEYANEAYFLTMPRALEHLAVESWPGPVQSLAASSDGLLRLALRLPGQEPYEPFFRPLFEFVASAEGADLRQRQLVKFLDSPRVCARTEDDKTLVVAVRSGAGQPGGAELELRPALAPGRE